MKPVWKIIIVIVLAAGIAFVLNIIDKTPAEIQEQAETISPQSGLPGAVAEKREAIAEAAKNKDYAALAALADAESFSYTFGGPFEGGFEAYLRKNEPEDDLFNKIYKLLSLPYIQQEDIYTWPAVFAKQTADWTEEDIEIMRELYTDEDIANFRLYGAYIGYRIGIKADGSWIYFIAGD